MAKRQLQFRTVLRHTENLLGPELAAALAEEELVKPDDLTDWDWAVFLLHTAAEVEHALMTQYLYAAYSLGPPFRGRAVPPDAATRVAGWQNVLQGIAREEMAHLATVQNLLRLIGGSLNFEREDFPFRTELYPYPFRLERLSKTSLAKYVAAEMPAPSSDPTDDFELIAEILERADADPRAVNRVGIVYSALIALFGDPRRISDADFRASTAETLQARKEDWHGSRDLLVREVASREEALSVLEMIARQGEGSDEPSPGLGLSHYVRLLAIYREFPDTGDGGWVPTKPVPDNPHTGTVPSGDTDVEASRITDPTTLLWARLFNLRYRMLLLDLAHAFEVEGGMGEPPDLTPRGHLRDRTFFEMRGRPPLRRAGLRGVARKLTTLPLKEGAPVGPEMLVAAPPFELPYSLAVPSQERDRWRLHQSLLESSTELVARIRAVADDPILQELDDDDARMRELVTAQLGVAVQ